MLQAMLPRKLKMLPALRAQRAPHKTEGIKGKRLKPGTATLISRIILMGGAGVSGALM